MGLGVDHQGPEVDQVGQAVGVVLVAVGQAVGVGRAVVHQAGTDAVGIPVGHVGNCVFAPGRVGPPTLGRVGIATGRVGAFPLGRVGALFPGCPKRQSAKSGKSQYPILEFQ